MPWREWRAITCRPMRWAGALLAATTAMASGTASAHDIHAQRHEPAPVALLRVEANDDRYLVWIDNALAGPIEVMLHATSDMQVDSDPPLPARATVPALQDVLVAALGNNDHAAALRVDAVPGHPSARPRDIEYAYPLRGTPLQITQAWAGTFSHGDDENRHAVDFAAATGTVVSAARDGVVMQIEDGFPADGSGSDAIDRANFIRILHDDGTMALYAHLDPGGAAVRIGERVRRGQAIGLSGNSGRSLAPHLHFVVQANRGMRLESLPFRMFGPEGILRFNAPHATP